MGAAIPDGAEPLLILEIAYGSSYKENLHKLHAELVTGLANGYHEICTTFPRSLLGKSPSTIHN